MKENSFSRRSFFVVPLFKVSNSSNYNRKKKGTFERLKIWSGGMGGVDYLVLVITTHCDRSSWIFF